jgi:hypothetical protein
VTGWGRIGGEGEDGAKRKRREERVVGRENNGLQQGERGKVKRIRIGIRE